jgi:predicted transcriptional regulator
MINLGEISYDIDLPIVSELDVVKIHAKLLCSFHSMKHSDMKTYVSLLLRNRPGKVFAINKDVLLEIGLETGLKLTSTRNSLSSLVRDGFISSGVSQGSYIINPQYAYKGGIVDWREAIKTYKASIRFSYGNSI